MRQTLGTLAAMFCIAGALAPPPVTAQAPVADAPAHAVDDADGGLADLEQRVSAHIREEENENGLLSPGLVSPLTMLALLYEEAGDYPLTLATVERARQIVRNHAGLYSIDEVPLLELRMRSESALGDVLAAWHTDEELRELVDRHPDDRRILPALLAIGDRRMDMVERYSAGEILPEVVLGCFYERSYWIDPDTPVGPSGGDCGGGSRRTATIAMLGDAWDYYGHAIRLLRDDGEIDSSMLAGLEKELILSSERHGNYPLGRESLGRLHEDDVARSASLLTRASSMVRIADWDIEFAQRDDRFENYAAALEMYADLYAELRDGNVAQDAIDGLFAPELPVVLPSFLPNPLASAPTSSGYIDVEFDVTPRGHSNRIRVLDRTGEATRADVSELTRTIKQASFRPRSTDGHFEEPSRVVVRFYPDGVDTD